MIIVRDNHRFSGREFAPQDVTLIQEVVESCPGISRTELSYTVSELLEWRRPNGGLKGRECLNFLERLESEGYFRLPESHGTGPRKGTRRHIAPAKDSPAWAELSGSVEAFSPLDMELVKSAEQRRLFKDLVSRYHYLGYAMAFGAKLQYLVYVTRPTRQVVGCVSILQSSLADEGQGSMDWLG